MATPRKRTRSGCLLCRSRRRKCDGDYPRCRNCAARGLTCQWGLKASFHEARNLGLARHHADALGVVEEQLDGLLNLTKGFLTIIDETDDITNCYITSRHGSPSSISNQPHDGSQTEDEPGFNRVNTSTRSRTNDLHLHQQHSPHDIIRIENLVSHTTPHTHDSSPAQSTALRVEDYVPPFSIGQASSHDTRAPPPEPPLPVNNAEKAHLISHFLQETGTWCETTDSQMQFTVRSIHAMMNSSTFAAAAMSLASRQLNHTGHQQRSITLELYQYTIQLLLRQDPAKADASVLATCTLLCVYEMMASEVSEWRRHLKGCAGLLQAKKWNGSSSGIVKTCFWAFARIDVWAAFNSAKTTLIPTDFWLDNVSIESALVARNIDDYCNLAILYFARIVNVLATSNVRTKPSHSKLTNSISDLWNELQKWYRLRPQEVYPIFRDSSSQRVFPTIVMTQSSSICGNTFYHAGSILLLRTGLLQDIGESESVDNALWHARELAGISISNQSHANWVNQLQPLFIAGTVFTTTNPTQTNPPYSIPSLMSSNNTPPRPESSEEKYAVEKILLLKHLALIERETGWKTSDRASELRTLWGFG